MHVAETRKDTLPARAIPRAKGPVKYRAEWDQFYENRGFGHEPDEEEEDIDPEAGRAGGGPAVPFAHPTTKSAPAARRHSYVHVRQKAMPAASSQRRASHWMEMHTNAQVSWVAQLTEPLGTIFTLSWH